MINQKQKWLYRPKISDFRRAIKKSIIDIEPSLIRDSLAYFNISVETCWVATQRSWVSALNCLYWATCVETSASNLWWPRTLAILVGYLIKSANFKSRKVQAATWVILKVVWCVHAYRWYVWVAQCAHIIVVISDGVVCSERALFKLHPCLVHCALNPLCITIGIV